MKDKIVIIGGGGHAKVIISIIKKLDIIEILPESINMHSQWEENKNRIN